VTDPTEDEEINMMLDKVRNDVEKEHSYNYESSIDPLVRAALEEDLAALQEHDDQHRFMTPVKPEKDLDTGVVNDETDIELKDTEPKDTENEDIDQDRIESPVKKRSKTQKSTNNQIEKSDKNTDSDKEPSESSFNEYSLQNEINMMTKNLEEKIDKEEQKSDNDISECNKEVRHEYENVTQDETIEKKLLQNTENDNDAKSQLEETSSVKLYDDDTSYLDCPKTEVDYKNSSPIKKSSKAGKNQASEFMNFLDTIEENSIPDFSTGSQNKSPKNTSPKSIISSFKGTENKSQIISMEVELQE
jgi:hypothetical protein